MLFEYDNQSSPTQDAILFKKKKSVYQYILWNGLGVFFILSFTIWAAVEVAFQNSALITLLTPWHERVEPHQYLLSLQRHGNQMF